MLKNIIASTGLIISALSGQAVAAGPTITVAEYPQTLPSPGVLVSVTGNLTQVDQKLSARKEAGQYLPSVNVVVTVGNVQSEDCCDKDGKPTGKVKAKIKADEMKIDVTFSHKVKLAEWANASDFAISCPDAVSEWKRYIGEVYNRHEALHHSFAMGWFTEQRMKSYFKDVPDFESKCYDPATAEQEVKEEFHKWSGKYQESKQEKILKDWYFEDNVDLDDPPGRPPYILDTSKDCSKPKPTPKPKPKR